MLRWIALPLLATLAAIDTATAQRLPNQSLQALLPTGAEIIETADLTDSVGKPRLMVLWMLKPRRNLDDKIYRNSEDGVCSDIIHGDFGKFREGPTRLSLVNSEEMRLINTIEIREGCPGCQERDTFTLPVCVLTPYSHMNNPLSDKVGKPNLNLRDLTGQGAKLQFALFIFEAYSIAGTGVFGYEPKSDRVMQYPSEIESSTKPVITLWTEEIFTREPLRPGYCMRRRII